MRLFQSTQRNDADHERAEQQSNATTAYGGSLWQRLQQWEQTYD